MKKEENYNSIKTAMRRRGNNYKLPGNFTSATMQRVTQAADARERRNKRICFFATVAASLLLIVGCIKITAPMVENFTFDLRNYIKVVSINIAIIKLYIPIFVAITLLLLLDIKLRTIFKKKMDR